MPEPWTEMILGSDAPETVWRDIFARLAGIAAANPTPKALHHATVPVDRLLAEAAWDLWQAYPAAALRTSQKLVDWCGQTAGGAGKAVLILDALSLHEMGPLLAGARHRGIGSVEVAVTGSEFPSETTAFAQAIGASQRSALTGGPPSAFRLFAGKCHTGVLNYPFEDCLGAVPNQPSIVLWHSWLDDLLHVHSKAPETVQNTAAQVLQSDGFWNFVNALRQGRSLVITADHGYTVSKLFSSAVQDSETIDALRETFGASRCIKAAAPWPHRFMPPAVCTANGWHAVMGQCKWTVQGGFPQICHGGLSLLEVAVPWVELPAL